MTGPDSLLDYESYDALGLAGLIRTRQASAEEIFECAVARFEALNPHLGCVVHPFVELGRDAIARGLPEGPFTGVPFLIKNMGIEVADTPLTTGSRLFEGVVSLADSTLAARYKAAGLVLFGKTTTPEFALSFATEPEAFRPARNPWDLSRGPGGSSGGAAAAVAAGIVPMANASDGAGSTRLPAAHCGLFGFKPSRMRNPLGPLVVEGVAGMSTQHALSWTVRDNAALLDETAGPDIGDPAAAPTPERPFLQELHRDPGPLRIGLILDSPVGTPVDPQITQAAREAAALCADLGHHIEEVQHGYDADALKAAWRVIAGVNAAQAVATMGAKRGIADPLTLIEPVNAAWVREARSLSGSDYLAAVNQLHVTARALGRFFTRYDVALSPTTGELPPKIGAMNGQNAALDAFYDQFWQHGPFTCAFNAAGCPAMSVPLAMSTEGLPIGIHFGAAFGREGLLFALAGQLERASPWFGRRPARAS